MVIANEDKQSHPVADIRFICDDMLGRFCKWLRILGFDTAYFRGSDAELVLQARREERVILTRDKRLAGERKTGPCYVFKSTALMDQLTELFHEYKIAGVSKASLFSRCLECNTPVAVIQKSEVQGRVPDYVFDAHDQFHQCPQCLKIYWTGTHVVNTEKHLERFIS